MKQESDIGFAAGLRAELETFQEFNRVLQQEQAALIAGETDSLLQLTNVKTGLMEKLSAFSAERERQMVAAGFKNDSAGISAWFKAIGLDNETLEVWNQLLTLARQAEQANRENGILIDTHLRHNQQALAVLKTAANPGNNLYGPNGQISGMSSGRPLGKV